MKLTDSHAHAVLDALRRIGPSSVTSTRAETGLANKPFTDGRRELRIAGLIQSRRINHTHFLKLAGQNWPVW